ncbi:protein O-GlcNAcase isoform X1 [Patella vulgata]|uniref:protein O-GlcNAcase isoform X1 n=1 Tax=Patella vulgata TaxID=6465 RepID=UPI00217FBC72|nr:protein O-GlcNAcase isoform X1 [Patella vulgata]
MVNRDFLKIGSKGSKSQHRKALNHLPKMKGKYNEGENNEETFISGVVEGFYGRPWTTEQRRLLFSWMKNMGLNTYMYAPKDDSKHRSFWRDMYSVEEAENLTNLIEAATENDITFVYAISPGLDMTFSGTKDVTCLKRKLEQVSTFGCPAFALLFDDIDPEISEADKSVFQSYACAQVSVTNEVYEYLNQPKFLFCPTEYCASRAVPNVKSSEYLNTIGAKLLPGIDVMWTGSKVVSKRITIQSLEEIGSVLRRPPLIWDNIHANDYDPRRIFLGPYDGRSPEIIPYLRGVMTNPNCEFESNYVACHTLAQWCLSNVDGVKKDIIPEDRLSPIAADIKLETESDFGSDEDIPCRLDARYQPHRALKTAINDWLMEFSSTRTPPKKPVVAASIPLSVNTCVASTPTSCSFPETSENGLPVTALSMPDSGNMMIDNQSYLQPATMNVVNSLIDEDLSDVSNSTESLPDLEPMDCIPPSNTSSANNTELTKNSSADSLMQVEISSEKKSDTVEGLSYDDVSLLVDLFYMPFEFGSTATALLQDLHWLSNNAHTLCENQKDEKREWFVVAKKFKDTVDRVEVLADKINDIPNKSLSKELYPYLWDVRGILQLCSAYVDWIGLGHVPFVSSSHLQNRYTWQTKSYRDAYSSGDQEPWVFRGGLQSELQRMLPIDTAHDLFIMKPPEVVSTVKYHYRPYSSSDERSVYNICLKTCDDGMDGTEVFPENLDLIGDRYLGQFINVSPEYCFVVEDDEGVCGYALAALDSKTLYQKSNMEWKPAMCDKYPKPNKEEMTPADEVIQSFHSDPARVPETMYSMAPSVIRLDILPNRINDVSVAKRLLACALSGLKTNGSAGVHCELNIGDKYMLDFYGKLGFFPLAGPESASEDVVYLGRLL